jgi:hypothetical protein
MLSTKAWTMACARAVGEKEGSFHHRRKNSALRGLRPPPRPKRFHMGAGLQRLCGAPTCGRTPSTDAVAELKTSWKGDVTASPR